MRRSFDIKFRVVFDEDTAVELLNALARANAKLFRARPGLPGVYESGVVYRRETREVWQDWPHVVERGYDDCDSLAAARAGELMARGVAALGPGDAGYEPLRRRGSLRSAVPPLPGGLRAEVFCRTRTRIGDIGAYHCLVRYWLNGREYEDDPSARLGMRGGRIDPNVRARRRRS